jgi:hypothetical protein
MKTKILTMVYAIGASLGALAQSNLILNPNFNQGNNSGVPLDWSSNAGGNYNYADSAAPSYAAGGQIFSLGWWDGAATWQNTGASVQANDSYALSVTAAVGQSPLTGVTLSFQDVTTGWTWVDSQVFLFSSADQTSGQYETFTLNIPQSALTGRVGDTIGVGISLNENPNTQYGWIHLDSVSLVASPVPEPTSLALLGVGALGGLRMLRRNKEKNSKTILTTD